MTEWRIAACNSVRTTMVRRTRAGGTAVKDPHCRIDRTQRPGPLLLDSSGLWLDKPGETRAGLLGRILSFCQLLLEAAPHGRSGRQSKSAESLGFSAAPEGA